MGGTEIRLLSLNDQQLWTGFLDSCKGGIFQTFEWAKVLSYSSSVKPAVAAVFDKEELIAGCVVAMQSIRGFYPYPFVQLTSREGPLYLTKEGLIVLLRDLQRAFSHCMSLSFLFSDSCLRLSMDECGYQSEQQCTFRLDLEKPLVELWEKLEKRTRYSIRKARKNGIKIEVSSSGPTIQEYLRLHKETCERAFLTPNLSLLSGIWDILAKSGKAQLFMAKCDELPVAGVMCLLYKDKIWYFSAASSTRLERMNAPTLLLWDIIEWAHNHEIRSLDLCGALCSPDRSSPQYGPYLFKRGFGGELVRACEFRKVLHGWVQALWLKLLVPGRLRLRRIRV